MTARHPHDVTTAIFHSQCLRNNGSRKCLPCGYFCSARATGLEPATTGSTGGTDTTMSFAEKPGKHGLSVHCSREKPRLQGRTSGSEKQRGNTVDSHLGWDIIGRLPFLQILPSVAQSTS